MNRTPNEVIITHVIPYLSCLDLSMLGITNKRFMSIRKQKMYKLFWHHVNKALYNIDFSIGLKALDDEFRDPLITPHEVANTRIVYSEIFVDIYSGRWFHKDFIHDSHNRLRYIHFTSELSGTRKRKPMIKLITEFCGVESGIYFYPTHDYQDTYWSGDHGYLKILRRWKTSIPGFYVSEKRNQRCMLDTYFGISSVVYNHLHVGLNPTLEFLDPSYEPCPYIRGSTLVVPPGLDRN